MMCLDVNENFEFLIGGEFLRLSLEEHLQEKALSSVWIYLCNFESYVEFSDLGCKWRTTSLLMYIRHARVLLIVFLIMIIIYEI